MWHWTPETAVFDLLNRPGAGLAADGDFGSRTEAAAKTFRKKAGQRQDGRY